LKLSKTGFFDSALVCSSLSASSVISHRQEVCQHMDAGQVPGFMEWSSGRARLVWIDDG
jgi:hypothetical protein